MPQYYLETHNNIDLLAKKDRIVYVEKNNTSVEDVRMAETVKSVLGANGWKVTDNKSEAKIVADYKTEVTSTLRNESVPVYGRTGVNSINTANYGNSSHSTVNYDYGVTGYENYTVTVNETCFKLVLRKKVSGEPVYNSDFCTSENVNPALLRSYVENVYSIYLENPDVRKVFYCNDNGTDYGTCMFSDNF